MEETEILATLERHVQGALRAVRALRAKRCNVAVRELRVSGALAAVRSLRVFVENEKAKARG